MKTESTIRILKSSSYICCLMKTDEHTEELSELSKDFNSRFFSTADENEFWNLLGQVKKFVAIIIDHRIIDKEILKSKLNVLKEANSPIFILEDKNPSNKEFYLIQNLKEANEIIKQHFDQWMPKRLDQLALFSANHILQYLNTKAPVKFQTTEDISLFKAEYTLSCQVQAPNLFGYCFLKIDTQNISKILDDDLIESEYKLMDFAKEMVNQFWGIICQNIGKTGVFPHVGIPIAYDSNGNAGMSKSYIPKLFLKDELGIFAIELGFMSLDQSIPFDLSNIEFSVDVKTNDEIELL